MIKNNLREFTWVCPNCGNKNRGWWGDAEFFECDECEDSYDFDKVEHSKTLKDKIHFSFE